MGIELYKGSILDCDVDVIGNAANQFLQHGGGIAGVIAKAAVGPLVPIHSGDERSPMVADEIGQAWILEQGRTPLVPTGSAVITSPGHLEFEAIVHLVGPVWGGGRFHEADLLYSAYMTAFSLVRAGGWDSVALPAVSAGIFGVPIEIVSECAVKAAVDQDDSLPHSFAGDIVFALMDDDHVAAFQASMGRHCG